MHEQANKSFFETRNQLQDSKTGIILKIVKICSQNFNLLGQAVLILLQKIFVLIKSGRADFCYVVIIISQILRIIIIDNK